MSGKVRCEVISWNAFYGLCVDVAFKVRAAGFAPQMIVAIGRGGFMPARVLSDLLGVMNLTAFKIEHYHGTEKGPRAQVRYPLAPAPEGQRVLLVDDVSDSGDTFQVAAEHVQERLRPVQISTAALHHKTVSSFVPDFYARKIIRWRWITYPWALVEDLEAFLSGMKPQPETVDEAARRLREDHGFRVPRKTLARLLALRETSVAGAPGYG